MKRIMYFRRSISKRIWMLGFLMAACGWTVSAQTTQYLDKPNLEHHTVVKKTVEEQEVVGNKHQVITNLFKDNWFVLGDAGVNTYSADYIDKKISTRITPQFNIGVGKWFVPAFGAKLQFTGFRSKANKYQEGLYTYNSEIYKDENGKEYWKEQVKWWDLNVNLMFNLSRLFCGYEGIGSPKLMHQFIASVGIGAVYIYDNPFCSKDWSGNFELQYSRFFSPKKDFSLDFKLRALLYETEFDGIKDQHFDENLSMNVGFTYYFKKRGWERAVSNTTYYVEDRTTINQLNEEINRLRNELAKPVEPVKVDTVVVNQIKSDILTYPYFVNFVIDKVEVVNRERVNLRVVAEMMKATPNQKYMICGYADKYTGTVARNIWLAEHRSKNVFKILTEEFGVPASQLVLDDKGGVDNMFYDDPQLSRSVIISKYNE